MLIALLLAGAAPQTAIEAERAFAADARATGQWSAFRKWSSDGAVMFVPEMVSAKDFLQPLKDPAKSVAWQPIASFVSCDGDAAVNTGAWQQPDGSVGYFTTLWSRDSGGNWRWELDHGDPLKAPRVVPAEPHVRHASCAKPVPVSPPFAAPTGSTTAFTAAPDDTLRVRIFVTPEGARTIAVTLWNGETFEPVIDDRVAPPPPAKP